MQKAGFHALLAAMLWLGVAGTVQAENSEGELTAREGVVRCGATNHLRQGGTEIHTTNLNLRNFGDAPITIQRLRFFDATGAVLFDTAGGALPPASNGVLGPANNVLNPNQTAQFDTDSLLPFLPNEARPLQAEVQWSAADPVLTLGVTATRLARQRDPGTGQMLAERARDANACRNISLR